MMTQIKHKIFNNKIKMLLLILIWTASLWQHCSATQGKQSSVAATAANRQVPGDVTKALTLFKANALHVAADASDVVFKNNIADTYNAIYANSSNSNEKKQALEGRLSDENKITDNDSDDDNVACKSNDDNASISDNGSADDNSNSSCSSEKLFALRSAAAELIDITNDGATTINSDDEFAVVENVVGDIESVDYLSTAANKIDSDANNDTVDDAETNDNEIESATLLLQKLIYDIAIVYKQIPRVTYFTCSSNSRTNKNKQSDGNGSDTSNEDDTILNKINTIEILKRMYAMTTATTSHESNSSNGSTNNNNNSRDCNNNSNFSLHTTMRPKGILIKVVQIDQFINKRRNNNNNRRRSSAASGYAYSYYERRSVNSVARSSVVGRSGASRFVGRSRFGSGQYSFTSGDWLEDALRSDRLRQIVVLDLSCGLASRKLIEMASNKALFNSSYHWLLIEEDYAYNRQQKQQQQQQQQQAPSNDNNNKVKKQDIIAATNINSKTVANRSAAAAAKSMQRQRCSYNGKYCVGNHQQRYVTASSNEPSPGAPTADAEQVTEIIEKFLEKINININTELILAKYRRRLAVGRREGGGGDGCDSGGGGDNVDDFFNKALQRQDYYMLYDVWSPGIQYGGKLNISEIGNFSLDDGLQIAPWYLRSTTITRRMDMKNARIRCLIVITNKNRTDSLEHYLTTRYDTHLDSMNRFNFALLSHVRDLYNFSFILSKTSSWGYLKNGKFDGMIGALVRKQTDIGGSPIFFRIERAKVIDYTSRTWVARPCFIFRHPRGTKKDRIVFLQPFSNDVWILLAFCGSVTIALLWTLSNVESKIGPKALNVKDIRSRKNKVALLTLSSPTLWQTNSFVKAETGRTIEPAAAARTLLEKAKPTTLYRHGQHTNVARVAAAAKQTAVVAGHGTIKRRCGNFFCGQDGNDASRRRLGLFLESVLFYIGSICQQGLAYSTSFFSGRCIVITSLFFSFAIYQFYSASIVGTLLMEKPKTIRTLRDLIHSSLEIGIEDIVYNRDFFVRTKDPDAIELYAKKVTSIPLTTNQGNVSSDAQSQQTLPTLSPNTSYRDILHSHEMGAHAKTNEASNWYDPEYGVQKIKKGRFAFHVDVATAYKIISDTFTEKEICDLTEIQLFPPQKMVSIVQKGSPLRKVFTYGLRRVTEVGLMDYQRKIWHSPKPRCVKQIHTDDLRVDMQTFTSALLVLIFGFAVSLLSLGLEIMHHNLWQRFTALEYE